MKLTLSTLILILMTSFWGCSTQNQGGSEAGNPPAGLRVVQGSLTSSSPAALLTGSTTAHITTCAADSIIATDTSSRTTTSTVASDCSFSMNLTVNRSYAITIALSNTVIATMTFNNSASGLASPVFYLSSGSGTVNLGTVSIAGRQSSPSRQPAAQCDRDGDDIFDYDDNDDDNDGTSDDDERDCDLDGILDDDDTDTSSCTPISSDTEIVTRVSPSNSGLLTDDLVNLDEEVEVRLSCTINESTITNETFQISPAVGDAIVCIYEISGDQVKCKHEADPFMPDTTYTATMNGVACNNGRTIMTTSWSWTTESE